MINKIKKYLSIILSAVMLVPLGIFSLGNAGAVSGEMNISALKVCSMQYPFGIDVTPDFSWKLSGNIRGQGQKAYRIIVSSAKDLAEAGTGDMWDSGKVTSDQNVSVAYSGNALKAKNFYYWRVEVWDTTGLSVKSEVGVFSTGMLEQSDWQADWIGENVPEYGLDLAGTKWIWHIGGGSTGSAAGGVDAGYQFFRKTFVPDPQKEIERVLIGYTADDNAVLYFNGVDRSSTSAWSTGSVYDATKAVVSGENTVAVAACNSLAGYAGLAAKIEIEYSDGTKDTLASGADWKVSKTEETGWQNSGFDDSAWMSPNQAVTFGSDPWGSGVSLEPVGSRAAVMLRKEFRLDGQIEQAFAYISGLGFFDLSINGKKPDDSVLNSFPTQYNKTVSYRAFDVTDLLQEGGNAVGVELGNSFYNEIGGVWNWQTASWRDNPKLLFQLEIRYKDGTVKTIVSDRSWKVTSDGPTTSNSMYYGDTYDARKEQAGFDTYGFDDSDWDGAYNAIPPQGELKAQTKEPVRRVSEFGAKEITKLPNGSYVITGEEMAAGWAKLMNINEEAGHKITITYGQALNEDGTVIKWGGADGKTNHWWPHAYIQQDNYIAKGTGNESFEPKFSYKGHQYIQIDGYSGELTKDDIVIYRVSNAVDVISEFETSNPMINTLHSIMVTAMANNFHGEHCDPVLEKTGWLGDANVSLDSLMYNYEMTGSLPGWIDVMEDCFEQYGTVTVTAPTADWWVDNTAVWNTLFVYGVEALENYFGKTDYAAGQYDIMREFVLKDITEIKNNGWVWNDGQLGDWVAPVGGSDPDQPYNENVSEGSGIVGTAYVYGTLEYMADLAGRLGKSADADEYREAMSKIYDAFNRKFYKSDLGCYQTDTWNQIGSRTRYRQTSNLIALEFGLVPKENVESVLENLVNDIKEKDYHLDTGCVGTKEILPVLCDYGYSDVAYRILTQTTYPSWGFWLENGAASTWEMWESTTRSYDHYFLGTYDEWFFSHLAGVRDIENGYKKYSVNPEFTGDLSFVNAAIDTPQGKLSVSWKLNGDNTVTLDTVVPFGAIAEIYLPTGSATGTKLDGVRLSSGISGVEKVEARDGKLVVTVGSGSYSFISETDLIPVYKVSLESAITTVENFDVSTLDTATKSVFTKALEGAKAVYENKSANQAKINSATDSLNELIALINGSEARKKLRAAAEKFEGQNTVWSQYTAETAAAAQSTLLTAKMLASDYRAGDRLLREALEQLNSAFEALTPSGIVNLALGKKAYASSSHEDSYWNWGLGNLNDGERKHEGDGGKEYTGYCSSMNTEFDHEEWVTVDLGEKTAVNNVVLYPACSYFNGKMNGYGFPVDFKIQVSGDNSNWATVLSVTDYPMPEYGALSFDFDTTEARYIRLLAEHLRPKETDQNSYRLQLSEMEIYCAPDSAEGFLSYISLSEGVLDSVFSTDNYNYTATVKSGVGEISVTAYVTGVATVAVNGQTAADGQPSAPITLMPGENVISIVCGTGQTAKTYTVTVNVVNDMPDRETLAKALEQAEEARRSSNYAGATESVRKSFDEAVRYAQAVFDDPDSSSEQVNSASNSLMDAINSLSIAAVDKTDLNAAIKRAEELDLQAYISPGKDAFAAALAAAKSISLDNDATQSEIDAAENALNESIGSLILKADKSGLETLLDRAKAIDTDEFTEQTAAVLYKAIAVAEAVFADEDARKNDVDAAISSLDSAIAALTKKDTPSSSDRESVSSENNESNSSGNNHAGGTTSGGDFHGGSDETGSNELPASSGDRKNSDGGTPKTGEAGSVAFGFAGLLTAGAAVLLTFKKQAK